MLLDLDGQPESGPDCFGGAARMAVDQDVVVVAERDPQGRPVITVNRTQSRVGPNALTHTVQAVEDRLELLITAGGHPSVPRRRRAFADFRASPV